MLSREPDWHSLVSSIDVNRDSVIDYNEFITAAYDRVQLINRKNLEIAFETLDTSKDGALSLEELRAGFAGYMVVASDKEWTDMISEVD